MAKVAELSKLSPNGKLRSKIKHGRCVCCVARHTDVQGQKKVGLENQISSSRPKVGEVWCIVALAVPLVQVLI